MSSKAGTWSLLEFASFFVQISVQSVGLKLFGLDKTFDTGACFPDTVLFWLNSSSDETRSRVDS